MACLPPVAINQIRVEVPISSGCALRLLSVLTHSQTAESITSFLAECPPLLFWSIAQAERCHRDLTLEKMVDWFQSSDLWDCLTNDSYTASNQDGDPTPFSQKLARKYFRALVELNLQRDRVDEQTDVVAKRLCKFVSKATRINSKELRRWLQSRDIQTSLWTDLSASIQGSDDEIESIVRHLCQTESICRINLAALLQSITDTSRSVPDFADRLQLEKMAAMKQLAYGASHEINNPLANIASRAQTLLRDETDPERRRKLASINQQAFRAHEMIADMMLFAHPPQPDLHPIELDRVVAQAVEELRPAADEQNTSIKVSLEKFDRVMGDRAQLTSAVQAIIQNALESVKCGGRIEISVFTQSFCAVVQVDDDGPGIRTEHMRHLFDPFFSGREAGRGLGFGLCKAWRIAELHSGSLSAKNRGEGGASFELRLPYADAERTELTREASKENVST